MRLDTQTTDTASHERAIVTAVTTGTLESPRRDTHVK